MFAQGETCTHEYTRHRSSRRQRRVTAHQDVCCWCAATLLLYATTLLSGVDGDCTARVTRATSTNAAGIAAAVTRVEKPPPLLKDATTASSTQNRLESGELAPDRQHCIVESAA